MTGTLAGVSLSWRPVVTSMLLLLMVVQVTFHPGCHASDLTETESSPLAWQWRTYEMLDEYPQADKDTPRPPTQPHVQRREIGRRRGHGGSRASSHRRQHEEQEDLQPREVYSAWSSWSQCNSRCEQKRERHCLHAPTCGNARHKEERSCNGGRCRQPAAPGLRFRVLRTSKRRGGGRGRGSRVPQHPGAPMMTNLFGKWSRWSPCTKTCTTRRYRWCKKPAICGNDVEREEAFCYVKGSFCHKWIFKRIRQHDENNEADADSIDEDTDVSILNPDLASEPGTYEQQCGIPHNVTNNAMALRIIGGRPAIRGRWPWQVAVLNRFRVLSHPHEAFCGGTLVAPQWVLTAAHCVRKRLYVKIGDHNLQETEGSEIELRVEDTVVHPNYDPDTVDNDLALLRLPGTGVRLDRYRGVACLPRAKHPLPVHKMCTIIGWGKRRPSDAVGTKLLHEAEVPIVPNEVCREVYEDYYITSNMFCAGHPRGRMDSCAGDSGGPLLCNVAGRWTIYGITSFGEGCEGDWFVVTSRDLIMVTPM
ncbi:hypothetical protein B566_EDAN008004 [Ephemera danica]|nr:hypothetical protein B566_EDAN008004 [Ephemera danica]